MDAADPSTSPTAGEGPSDLECRECVDLLGDYLEGTLPRAQAELLEWHLDGCAPCVAFLNTYRGTVNAVQQLKRATLPPELRNKLVAFLKSTRDRI